MASVYRSLSARYIDRLKTCSPAWCDYEASGLKLVYEKRTRIINILDLSARFSYETRTVVVDMIETIKIIFIFVIVPDARRQRCNSLS